MRVLHVINGLGAGGAERSLSEMLPVIRDAGVDCAIACLWRKPEGVHASVAAAGFPVHVIGSQKAQALRRLRALISGGSPTSYTPRSSRLTCSVGSRPPESRPRC